MNKLDEMTDSEEVSKAPFFPRRSCPFCDLVSSDLLIEGRYQETQGANPDFPDVLGSLFLCQSCGVAYPSHVYTVEAFPILYHRDIASQDCFHRSYAHRLRLLLLRWILRKRDRRLSFSMLLDRLFLHALLVPPLSLNPRSLRVLDFGCGYGDFSQVFRDLGNQVEATEIVPALVQRMRAKGFKCHHGELEALDFEGRKFDLIFMRGTLYRTRDPAVTLESAKQLLVGGGEIACVDPYPGPGHDGVGWFFWSQFPQGQFYIIDLECYRIMLKQRFGLRLGNERQIYGRPKTHLKKMGTGGFALELVELVLNNLLRHRPYHIAYTLRSA